jgi:hypothetical protein
VDQFVQVNRVFARHNVGGGRFRVLGHFTVKEREFSARAKRKRPYVANKVNAELTFFRVGWPVDY